MEFAKPRVCFSVIVAALSLSGCQLMQLQNYPQALSPTVAHPSQSTEAFNEQMNRYLSHDGRDAFLNQMLVALESDSRDRFKGKDPETYSWWKIRVLPSEKQRAQVVLSAAEGVNTSSLLEFMDVSYRTKTKLNLRSHPGIEGKKLGVLAKGEVFNVLAKVSEHPWFLVEQDGVIAGYVHKDYAYSTVVNRDILSTQPNSLLSFPKSSETASRKHKLSGHYICRLLTYELTKDGGMASGALRACRKKRKVWYIETPHSGQVHPT